MKFSQYFLSPAARFFAALIGILSGTAIGLFWDWKYGLLIGSGIALLTSVFLPLKLYVSDLPYLKEKERFVKPFLFDERVQFTVQNGTVGGFCFLTKEKIVFLSLENGKHSVELSKNDVKSVILNEAITMSIFLNNTQYIRVMSGACEEMYQILSQEGWKTAE